MALYAMIVALAVSILTTFSLPCWALDPPRSLAAMDMVTELNQNAAALEENVQFFNMQVPDSQCPVCEDNDDSNGRALPQILAKASRLMRRSSSFASFGRAMKTRWGRRRYNKSVSKDVMVPILTETASHFAALSIRARDHRAKASTTSPVDAAMFGVLEELATVSATVANQIAAVIQGADRATAGLVATSALSMFGFVERVNLAVASLLVDYLRVGSGENVEGINGKRAELQTFLSAKAPDGVFGNVIGFLSARGDKMGLLATLSNITGTLSAVGDRIVELDSSMNATALDETESDMELATHENTAVERPSLAMEASGLITGIVLVSVNSMQRIALDSFDGDTRNVLVSATGIIVQSVDSILNQSLLTINSVLTLLRSDRTSVSGDTILFFLCVNAPNASLLCILLLIPLFIVTLPLTLPAAVILFIVLVLSSVFSIGTGFKQRAACYKEAVACRSRALSAALPTV